MNQEISQPQSLNLSVHSRQFHSPNIYQTEIFDSPFHMQMLLFIVSRIFSYFCLSAVAIFPGFSFQINLHLRNQKASLKLIARVYEIRKINLLWNNYSAIKAERPINDSPIEEIITSIT